MNFESVPSDPGVGSTAHAPADRGVHDHLVLSRLMHAGKAKRRAERLRDEESAATVRLMASVSDGLILCSKSPFV